MEDACRSHDNDNMVNVVRQIKFILCTFILHRTELLLFQNKYLLREHVILKAVHTTHWSKKNVSSKTTQKYC